MGKEPSNQTPKKTDILSRLRAEVDTVIQKQSSHQNTTPPGPKYLENKDNWDQYTYIKQSRRAARTTNLALAKSLLLEALEQYPQDSFVLLEMSKHLEHKEKNFQEALEIAQKTPEEAEGRCAHEKRIARLRDKV